MAVKTLMLALLIVLPSAASAQTHRASVRGTITDQNGAVIPGASVKIHNDETLEARSVTGDSQGEFAVTALPAGSYTLSVQATGFDRFPQKLILQVNQELRLNVVMEAVSYTHLRAHETGRNL